MRGPRGGRVGGGPGGGGSSGRSPGFSLFINLGGGLVLFKGQGKLGKLTLLYAFYFRFYIFLVCFLCVDYVDFVVYFYGLSFKFKLVFIGQQGGGHNVSKFVYFFVVFLYDFLGRFVVVLEVLLFYLDNRFEYDLFDLNDFLYNLDFFFYVF